MTSAKETKRFKMDKISNKDNANAVVQKSLVLDNILKFLPFSDVQALSLVNRDFLRAVCGSKRWNELNPDVVLKVTSNSKKLQNYLSQLKTPLRCRVKINVTIPSETLDLLLPFLGSVEFVALMAITNRRSAYDINDNESRLSKLLLSVLRSTRNLTHLQMDVRFLRARLSDVLSSPAVVRNLKNLKQLEILECDYYNPGTFRGSHGPMYKVPVHPDISRDEDDNVTEDEERRYVPFAHNLRQLSVIPMRLESFKMAKVSICYGPEAQAMYLQHLLTIVTNSRKTLQDLSLHRAAWSSLELRELKMPALKRLTVTVERTNCLLPQVQETETLAAFLRNHPTLEELDVEAEEKICDILMPAIQDCRQLKKLHIKTRKFSWYVNWSFLGSLVHLKDFAIVKPEPPQPPRWRGHPEQSLVSYGTGRSFLAALPKNQLESLTLKGISKMNPRADTQDDTSVGFWNSSVVKGGLTMKIHLLQGFTCLRKLSLINCLDSLDNQLMQFILKEFVLLEELEVSHCYNLSDAGITGMGSTSVKGKPNVSIANLRSLKSLIIRKCPLVTPEGLASCLTLPSLKSLEYMTAAPILEWFLLAIAEQNASLESLSVNYGGKWSEVKKHLKANSRLKRVGDPMEDYADLDSEPDSD